MTSQLQLQLTRLTTPIGQMLIVADHDGQLRAIDWSDYEDRMLNLLRRYYGNAGFALTESNNLTNLTAAITRYFAGDLRAIENLPVATGGTPFQRQVWQALRQIPCGTTLSYAQLAARIGRPAAVRAVGTANGANPIGVVIPCHRVIGSNGSLTGYGGGLERKRWLLAHERQYASK